jgi:hypothetical protein
MVIHAMVKSVILGVNAKMPPELYVTISTRARTILVIVREFAQTSVSM